MPRPRALIFPAALLILCGTFAWLLFANRNVARPAPASAVWGPPDTPVVVVSYNILHSQRGTSRVVEEIARHRPDFVLLQEVERRDLSEMSRALAAYPAVYHASENLAGPRASWGNAILSRHPLYEYGSIPNPGGGSFGVWATAVVGGKKFRLASVHLSATWNASPSHVVESSNNRHKELTNLVAAWQRAGSPPMLAGGDFNQLAIHNNYELMTRHWTDALKALGHTDNTFGEGLLRTRIDYFLATRDWKLVDGGVGPGGASDHRLIWVKAKSS